MLRRTLMAFGVIVILVAGALIVDAAFSDSKSSVASEPTTSHVVEALMRSSEDAGTVVYQHELDDRFKEEIINTSEFDEVYASEDGKIVGLVSSGTPEEQFDEITQILSEKEWERVESDQPLSAAFVKREGNYTWLLLGCSGFEKTTTTVIQVQ